MKHLIHLVQDEERSRYLKTLSLSLAQVLDAREDYIKRRYQAEKRGSSDDRRHRTKMKEQREAHRYYTQGTQDACAGRAAADLASCIRDLRRHGCEVGMRVTNVGFNTFGTHFSANSHPEDPPAWGYDRICDDLGYRPAMDRRWSDKTGWSV